MIVADANLAERFIYLSKLEKGRELLFVLNGSSEIFGLHASPLKGVLVIPAGSDENPSSLNRQVHGLAYR